MHEQWNQWRPIGHFAPKYYITAIIITRDSIIDIATTYEPKIETIADITQHKVVV